jgi:hypothetical protein
MYSDDENDLTTEEITALASLPREMAPSDILEERVVRALRSAGNFGSPTANRGRGLDAMWKVAAAVALFAGGVATGSYLTTNEMQRSASISAPSSRIENLTPTNGQTPATQNETIVAEREMWL